MERGERVCERKTEVKHVMGYPRGATGPCPAGDGSMKGGGLGQRCWLVLEVFMALG